MKQYFRRPQDVVGEDRDLLTYWNTMSGKVQLRLLESGLSVSTLGELKMLQEQIEHEGLRKGPRVAIRGPFRYNGARKLRSRSGAGMEWGDMLLAIDIGNSNITLGGSRRGDPL